MRAAVTMRHGGLDTLEVHEDWPKPTPGPGDVVVRVTAAAVNNTDLWSRLGAYGSPADPDEIAGWNGVPLRFPLIQGLDIAGVVEEVGEGVDSSLSHARVIVDPTTKYEDDFPVEIAGSESDGGYAQFHRTSAERVHRVDGSPLTDAQLASIPCAYGTALGMINRADCRAGQRVLVTGSSGGVGSAAIQLLVHRGCHVIAHTSAAKREEVAALGAHEVTVRGTTDLERLRPVDAAVDVVGGEEFMAVLGTLRRGGSLVTAGAIAGPVIPFDVRQLYLHQRTVIGSTMHTQWDFIELAEIATTGALQPVVSKVFPLGQVHEAHRAFEAKKFTGKLVLDPWAD